MRGDLPSFRVSLPFFNFKQLQLAPAPDKKLGKMIDFPTLLVAVGQLCLDRRIMKISLYISVYDRCLCILII